MRAVFYDLYTGNTLMASTEDFDRAIEWRDSKRDHSYKVRVEEIIPVVDPKVREYRMRMIAKKNAIRAAKKAAK